MDSPFCFTSYSFKSLLVLFCYSLQGWIQKNKNVIPLWIRKNRKHVLSYRGGSTKEKTHQNRFLDINELPTSRARRLRRGAVRSDAASPSAAAARRCSPAKGSSWAKTVAFFRFGEEGDVLFFLFSSLVHFAWMLGL